MVIMSSLCLREKATQGVWLCLVGAMEFCKSAKVWFSQRLTGRIRNPGGIRFGSAEIYDVIDVCFSEGTPGLAREMIVVDALCVGQKIGVEQADERVLLFVKLMDGVTLGPELISAIAREVRNRRSPRHVPAKCIQVEDVPYTLNGKKVEVPVRKVSASERRRPVVR